MNPGALGVRIRRATWLCAAIAFALLLLAAPAHAAFPGKNGKIAFTRYTSGDYEIWDMNPDGSGRTRLTNVPGTDTQAAWSPDGTRIAFTSNRTGNNEIWVMNADGSNQVPFTVNPANDNLPAWSPDGTKIAFTSDRDVIGGLHNNEIYVMNSDGSGQTRITSNPPLDPQDPSFTGEPRWSPDGRKIVFTTNKDLNYEVYVMNADGTGQTRLTNLATDDESPDWSPDGSKIAFVSDRESGHQIWVMNPDGSGQVRITSDAIADLYPAWSPDGSKFALTRIDPCCSGTGSISQIYTMNADGTNAKNLTNEMTQEERPAWQPIPINGYPRPKGATPFLTYLSVAYSQCTAANANHQHGGPLSASSCYPASSHSQTSKYLTVGTGDAWPGTIPKSIGSVRLDVKPTPPEDVKIATSVTDVRCNGDGFNTGFPGFCANANSDNALLPDYTGELQVSTSLRITDKDNTPSPDGGTGAATVADMPFAFAVPCGSTPDTTIGSACALTTTANTLVPGAVPDGLRSNWQLGPIQVYDGGADGSASTADNTLFMDEGMFVP